MVLQKYKDVKYIFILKYLTHRILDLVFRIIGPFKKNINVDT